MLCVLCVLCTPPAQSTLGASPRARLRSSAVTGNCRRRIMRRGWAIIRKAQRHSEAHVPRSPLFFFLAFGTWATAHRPSNHLRCAQRVGRTFATPLRFATLAADALRTGRKKGPTINFLHCWRIKTIQSLSNACNVSVAYLARADLIYLRR